MKYTEQELAEKMKKRLASERDRQRRWRLRQKEKGLKPVAGMISNEAQEILNAEKKETRKTTSAVLEKAILSLPRTKTPSSEDFSNEHSTLAGTLTPKDKSQKNAEDTINRIKKMRRKDNLPFNEIAKIFNAEGLKTLEGDEEWDGKSIYTIYKNIENK